MLLTAFPAAFVRSPDCTTLRSLLATSQNRNTSRSGDVLARQGLRNTNSADPHGIADYTGPKGHASVGYPTVPFRGLAQRCENGGPAFKATPFPLRISETHASKLLEVCRFPDRRPKRSHVNFRISIYAICATPRLGNGFSPAISQYAVSEGIAIGKAERCVPRQHASTRSGPAREAAMSRELIWIDQERFRGFGCSACGWRFQPSSAAASTRAWN
jgi:hypothetical protein